MSWCTFLSEVSLCFAHLFLILKEVHQGPLNACALSCCIVFEFSISGALSM